MNTIRSILALATLALLAPATRSGVVPLIVVDDDGGPGVDALDLATAVLAAPPGSTVLVRSGLYGGFVLDGKGLVVTSERDAVVRVSGGVRVSNRPPTSRSSCTAFASSSPAAATRHRSPARSTRSRTGSRSRTPWSHYPGAWSSAAPARPPAPRSRPASTASPAAHRA